MTAQDVILKYYLGSSEHWECPLDGNTILLYIFITWVQVTNVNINPTLSLYLKMIFEQEGRHFFTNH